MLRKKIKLQWNKIILPASVLILVIVGNIILTALNFQASDELIDIIQKLAFSVIFIIAGWLINKLITILINYSMQKHTITKADNLNERKLQTRMKYVKLVLHIIVFLISLALALRQFESMRQLSTSILTSAGIAGIVLAFSAQKLFANVLAGFEIAFTQPIRIDDVVIVEGEWGRIEEINTTHVVVKIWDQRRLVLPITYFVEKPFQNWTKTTADIWGTADFFVDYTMPIDKMREELTRILNKNTALWDGKVNSLQVTDTNERTMKVRALMSTRNSGDAWDLRCIVREEMITFLQQNYPKHLPKLRADIITKESD